MRISVRPEIDATRGAGCSDATAARPRRWLVSTATAEQNADDVFVTRRRVDPSTDQLVQRTSHDGLEFTRVFKRLK